VSKPSFSSAESAKSPVILTALIVGSLAARLLVSWGDFDTLLAVLADDSFYSLGIARSISRGYGPTFDGIALTNGFQPLYVLLVVPIYWIWPGNGLVPLHLALSIISIFSVGMLVLLWKIVLKLTQSRTAAFATCCIWAFLPVVFFQELKGLETSISSFFVTLCTWYVVSIVSKRAYSPGVAVGFGKRELVTLGSFLGLALWARVDNVFLLVAILLFLVWIIGKRALVVGAIAGAAYAPWVLWSYSMFGTVLQVSGEASRFLYHRDRSSFVVGVAESIWSLGVKLAYEIVGHHRPFATFLLTNLEFSLLVSVAIALLGLLLFKRAVAWRAVMGHVQKLVFLFVFAGLVFVFYTLYFWRIDLRYFSPVYLTLAIAIALLVDGISKRKSSLGCVLSWLCAFGAVMLLVLNLLSIRSRTGNKALLYNAARWIDENIDKDALIGSFNAGIIGYFSEHTVINLDGLVNNAAFEAHREGQFTDYVQQSEIQYIVDFSSVVTFFGNDVNRLRPLQVFQDRGLVFQPDSREVVVWQYALP
jgi:hypothetical protein